MKFLNFNSKKTAKIFIGIGLSFMTSLLTAQNFRPDLRVDIDGEKNSVGLIFKEGTIGAKGKNADWINDKKDFRLVMTSPVQAEWELCSFTFIPQNNGEIKVYIMANYQTVEGVRKYYWVLYDDFSVEGAELQNGSFENIKSTNSPLAWNINSGRPALVEDENIARDGKNCIKVTHNDRFMQKILVTKDVPVKITFWAKVDSPLEFQENTK